MQTNCFLDTVTCSSGCIQINAVISLAPYQKPASCITNRHPPLVTLKRQPPRVILRRIPSRRRQNGFQLVPNLVDMGRCSQDLCNQSLHPEGLKLPFRLSNALECAQYPQGLHLQGWISRLTTRKT